MRAVLSLLVFLTVPAFGQSALPPCDSNVAVFSWTNCQGTLNHANGSKYVGEFKGGRSHGQGTSTWANGDKYVGEWRDKFIDGQGTLNHANGDKYVGEFKDNKRNGQGIYTFANGSPPLEGVWVWGDFARAQRIPDHIAGRTTKQSDLRQQAAGSSVNQPAASPASKFDLARGKCGDLGLKPGTEKFGECVLRLSK